MSDTPRRDGPQQPQQPYGNQGPNDPAYQYPPPLFAGQDQSPTHAAPRSQSGFHEANTYPSPADANPTQQLPSDYQQGGYDSSQHNQYGQPPPNQYGQQPPNQYGQQPPNQYGQPPPNQYGQPPPNQYGGQPWSDGAPPQPPDPEGPGSRIWLWALAGVAVLLVIGLVVAVFIVTGSSQETVVAPPIQPSGTAVATTPRTTSRAPAPAPSDTSTTQTSVSGTPGATEEVVYTVSGQGKALNITYIDDGGVLQTEFNVTLPWTKTVKLDQPARNSASVSIVKLGGEISCTITVAGAQISTKSGRGVTMCKGSS